MGFDLIGFLVTFGGGWVIGIFFGIAIGALMKESDKEEKDGE